MAIAAVRTSFASSRVVQIEGVIRRQKADQRQQDQPHPFLSVVRAVGEAHAAARGQQHAANPVRRVVSLAGRMVEIGLTEKAFHDQQQTRRRTESDEGRDEQRQADLPGFASS